MEKPGRKSLQLYETSAPEQLKDELADETTEGNCCPSSAQKSEPKTSLHSCKEQKQRPQIRTSCQRLCDLLPFVSGQLDTATTLELTVKYISYLKESLPPDVLSEVNLAVEKKVCNLWENVPQKKRKTIRLKRNTSQRAKPAARKSNKGRSTQLTCKQVNQPNITVTYPLTMNLMLPQADSLTTEHAPPILLDKSTVPRGQMLPVCQDQFLSASFQFVENNWINQASALANTTSCAVTTSAISHTSLPQMGPDQSSSHILWDVTSSLVGPVAYPSINSGQPYSPPKQTAVTDFIVPSVEQSLTDSPLLDPPDSVSVQDFIDELLTPPSAFQSATSDDLTPENGTHPELEALCDPTHVQESDLCSSSTLTDSHCDLVSPFWLDLLLDSSDNFCFPDANLVDIVLSPQKGST